MLNPYSQHGSSRGHADTAGYHGEFFLHYADFLKYFARLHVCMCSDKWFSTVRKGMWFPADEAQAAAGVLLGGPCYRLCSPIAGVARGSADTGVEGFFDPPGHLLTSFHTVRIVEFGGHLPSPPSF
jgi:hypothetical protein